MRCPVKQILSCLLIGMLTDFACYAVPAYRPKIKVAVEGGEVYIQLCGDESCKYAITEDGYTILRDSIGWLYAAEDDNGNVVPTKYRLVHKSIENAELKSFLCSVNKGIAPTVVRKSTCAIQKQLMSRKTSSKSIQPVIGERRALIILMQFADRKFLKNRDDFENLFNEVHYGDDGAIGSVYDYYKEMSYGQLNLKSDIIGPYTSQFDMAYYGRNTSFGGGDRNPLALFEEALKYAQSDVDFSRYDSDNDGYVDNIHIIFAGYGEETGASPNAIWSHEMTFYQPITVQSLYVDRYSCSPELRGNKGNGITRIGVICHEIGHALGAMDFYDTDYSEHGEYYGTGEWDIMGRGGWNDEGINPADFNPYVKAVNFGWVNPSMILDAETNIDSTLRMMPNEIYKINTENGYDYFLLENVRKKGVFSPIHGEGLMIYHIGECIDEKTKTNSINTTYPQECYPICASAKSSYPFEGSKTSFGDINSSGCPYPGSSNNHRFSIDSRPAAWDCREDYIGVSLVDIVEDIDGSITCRAFCEEQKQYGCLWSETFDDEELPTGWKQMQLIGNGTWSIKKELYNINGESSKKSNGLAMLKSVGGMTSLDREPVVVSLQSEVIGVNADCDSLLLSFELKHEHKLYKKDDYIILYVKNIQDATLDSMQLILTEDIDWKKFQHSLLKKEDKIQLVFLSNMDARSKLYIDNINIHAMNASLVNIENREDDKRFFSINDKVYEIPKKIKADVKVYDSNGTVVAFLDMEVCKDILLPMGLYFFSDGYNFFKIWVY